jgi:hypothetical protein
MALGLRAAENSAQLKVCAVNAVIKLSLVAIHLYIGVVAARADDNGTDGIQKQRVRYLVNRLASKNPSPEENALALPKNYDKDSQVGVYLAVQQLLHEGSAAFDTLIQHSKDDRYSHTFEEPSGFFNRSVGVTCQMIMRNIVLAHEKKIHFFAADQYQTQFWKSNNMENWWKSHRDRPLWRIQADAIDEQLRIMETIEYLRMKPIQSRGGQHKLSKQDFDKLRDENIKILTEFRSHILSTKEPLLPDTIDKPYDSMIGLPWFDGYK